MQSYQSAFNAGPVGAAIIVAIALPVALPLYTQHRKRAILGQLAPARYGGRLTLASIAFVAVSVSCAGWRGQCVKLLPPARS
jgi:hypothetical protein